MFSISNFSNLDNFFSPNPIPIPFFQKKNTYDSLCQESKFQAGGILCDENLYGKCLLPDTKIKINNQCWSLDYFYHQVLNLESNDILNCEEKNILLSGKYLINSYDAHFGQIESQPITGILVQRIYEPIKIIELENGMIISSTLKHRFLRMVDNKKKIYEWAHDIDVGDRIMTVDIHHESIIHFKMITRVTVKPYQGLVYDLQINKTHNFVAEGIVCHNTSLPVLSSNINPKKFFKFSKSKPKQEKHLIICPSFRISFWKQIYSHSKSLILNNKNHIGKLKTINLNSQVNQIICTYNFLELDVLEVKSKLFQHNKFESLQVDFMGDEIDDKKNTSFWNQLTKIKSHVVWFIINYHQNMNQNYNLENKLINFFNQELKNIIYQTDKNSNCKRKKKIKSIGLNFSGEEKNKYQEYLDKFKEIYAKNQIKFEDDIYLQKFCSFPQSNIKINYFSLDSSYAYDIFQASSKLIGNLGEYQNILRNTLKGINSLESTVECNICLQNINPQDLGITECGHIFCYSCLLKNQRYQSKCPRCRNNISSNNIYLYIQSWENSALAHQNIIQKCKNELNLGTKISSLLKLVLSLKKKIIIISNFEENLGYLKDIFTQFQIKSLIVNNKNYGQVSLEKEKKYQVYLINYQFKFYKLPDNSSIKNIIFNEPLHQENNFSYLNLNTLRGIYPKANYYQLYLRNSIEEPKIINTKIKVY